MKINTFKNSLTALVVASTLFGAFSASAFQNLGPAQNGSNSGVFLPTTGYNYVASNVLFFIEDGDNIGTTGNVSIDNNNGFPGNPFSNTSMTFLGNSAVTGDIGASNPINLITLRMGGVSLQGPIVNVDTFNFLPQDINIGSVLVLTSATGMTFNANVTSSQNNYGLVLITHDATINGNLGDYSSGKQLSEITLQADVTLNGDIFADKLLFMGDRTLTLIGNHTIRSTINTQIDGTGNIIVINRSVFTENIEEGTGRQLKNLLLNAPTSHAIIQSDFMAVANVAVQDGIFEIQSDLTFDGSMDVFNGATLFLRPGASLNIEPDAANTFDLMNNTTLKLDMAGNFDLTGFVSGSTLATTTVDPNSQVQIVRPAFSILPQTTDIVIDNFAGGANLPATLPVIENSFLSSFEVNKVGNVLELSIQSTPLSVFATQPNIQGLAEILDLISMTGATGSLLGIIQQLGFFTNLEDLLAALNSLAPIVDGAIVEQSFEMQRNMIGFINERMDRLSFWRNHLGRGHLGTGLSNGDGWFDFNGWYDQWDKGEKGFWLKLWHQHSNQQEVDDLPGYKSNLWGLVGGFDSTINEVLLVGASLGYGFAEMHHRISPHAETKLNSFNGILYGSLDCYKPWFFNGQIGLAYNMYDLNRTIEFGELVFAPDSETDAWQLGLNVESGYVFDCGTMHLIPSVSLFYSKLWLDGYDEGNVGTASLTYEDESYDTLLLGLGANLTKDFVYKLKLIQPAVHAYYYYDFISDRMRVDAAFTGFGPEFTAIGIRPERNSFQVGASLTVYTLKNTVFEVNYDYGFTVDVDELKIGDYQSHTGFIKWRISLP